MASEETLVSCYLIMPQMGHKRLRPCSQKAIPVTWTLLFLQSLLPFMLPFPIHMPHPFQNQRVPPQCQVSHGTGFGWSSCFWSSLLESSFLYPYWVVLLFQIDCSLSILSPRFSWIHLEMAERLLAAKADMEAENKDGDTPLIIAAFNNRKECVDSLVKACHLCPSPAMPTWLLFHHSLPGKSAGFLSFFLNLSHSKHNPHHLPP